jgi:hypothetical protein
MYPGMMSSVFFSVTAFVSHIIAVPVCRTYELCQKSGRLPGSGLLCHLHLLLIASITTVHFNMVSILLQISFARIWFLCQGSGVIWEASILHSNISCACGHVFLIEPEFRRCAWSASELCGLHAPHV